eukprot:gene11098-biopygen1415
MEGVRGGDGALKKLSTPLTELTTYTLHIGGCAWARWGIEKALHLPEGADDTMKGVWGGDGALKRHSTLPGAWEG